MEEILIIDDSKQICSMLAEYVLPELGYASTIAHTGRQGLNRLRQRIPDLILLDLQLPDISGLDLLRMIAQEGYDVPVILMTAHGSEAIAVEAFRLGARNYLIKPFSETEAQAAIDRALRERRLKREKELLTRNLRQRVQELTVLYSIGKSVSSLLDLEELLVRIVEAGVYITRAEEGFLLLRDPNANELYLRAAKNLGEQRAQKLRMPIDDSLAGQVIRTGKPIRLDKAGAGAQLKVITGFLVRAILQVPLMVGNQVIGVLAVDNQQSERTFSENDQYLLSALADYAAIAIENARLYQKVKQSEARYRDLFDNANDLIFTLDRQLNIRSINKVGPTITGYAGDDLIGRPLRTMLFEDAWAPVERLLSKVLRGETTPPFELQLRRYDEETVVLEVSARLIRDGDRAEAIHCIARDLTERRRLEEQLIRSEKLSAIGQLVAGVAHEVNNPLTSISGYTQLMLRDTSLSPGIREDLQHINTQAERAARIVQNLLMFAREHKPQRTLVDINQVLQSTLTLRAYQLRVDNITIVTDFAPNLPQTVADPHQLQQVFLNLINNAHQAMTERGGKGTLTLRTSVEPCVGEGNREERCIRIAVSDTGVGISPRNLSRIFDPFFTTKPVGQGTGLGLSICFGIIQEHHGRLWAESEVGVGTTMYVELPLTHDYEIVLDAPDEPSSTVVEEETNAEETNHGAAILVVDDEEAVRALLARLLTDLGHRPTTVASGEAAFEIIAQRSFDLILTDIKMPGMTGFELYQHIRQRDPHLAQRIIFITGDTITASTQARLAQTGNPYLAKPFAIERLEALVNACLASQSAGQLPAP
ncbi:response regulator [Roseiflexus sp.]|uniref:response regulator n=1 Tax=Roseiflexus sp. TaxID=2562120 RepID=UPI0021DF05EB|nr:response regulator [Roseiflexus sp.]GIW01162.1 MAG: signal transduction histidine kinase [Roseiflexus sp.]